MSDKKIVYHLNLRRYNNFFFSFEIIFLTHSSMHFIVFGHLVDFEFASTKQISIVFCHFVAPITYCINILAHTFLIFCILTPFPPNSLLHPSIRRPKFIEFLLFGSPSH